MLKKKLLPCCLRRLPCWWNTHVRIGRTRYEASIQLVLAESWEGEDDQEFNETWEAMKDSWSKGNIQWDKNKETSGPKKRPELLSWGEIRGLQWGHSCKKSEEGMDMYPVQSVLHSIFTRLWSRASWAVAGWIQIHVILEPSFCSFLSAQSWVPTGTLSYPEQSGSQTPQSDPDLLPSLYWVAIRCQTPETNFFQYRLSKFEFCTHHVQHMPAFYMHQKQWIRASPMAQW